jgi:SAM-dependent methyltransferase
MQVSKEAMMPFMVAHMEAAIAVRSEDTQTAVAANTTHEWKFMFKPDANTRSTFEYVIQSLRSNPAYTETMSSETLQVTPVDSDVSLYIHGVPHISKYCLNEIPDHVPYAIKKTKTILSEQLPDELPLHVVSHVCETGDMAPSSLGDFKTGPWKSTLKNYKITKNFAYTNKDTGITFNVSIVKTSAYASTTMSSSGVSNGELMYEYAIIMSPRDFKDPQGASSPNRETAQSKYMSHVLEVCVSMIQLLTQQSYPLSKAQQLAVLKEYNALVEKELPDWVRKKNRANMSYYFLAPKPITLECMHLTEPSINTYGITSVLKGYAVTDKADGERMLMYVNETGEAYMINNTFDVFYTGLQTSKKEYYKSVLDGEYILANKMVGMNGGSKDMFAVFDIYFQNGESLMKLPLLSKTDVYADTRTNRFAIMKHMCEPSGWSHKTAAAADGRTGKTGGIIELTCKEHVPGDGKAILEACCKILADGQRKYTIDGLIFTPRDLSVFGYYPGVHVPLSENPKWDRVFKWKPSDQNTIDFLIREVKDANGNPTRVLDTKTNKYYKKFELFTGYNSSQWEPINPLKGMLMRYDHEYRRTLRDKRSSYVAKKFEPLSFAENGVSIMEIPVNEHGVCVDSEGLPITTNTIVECAYNVNKTIQGVRAPISRRWEPLRTREDKTRILQKQNTLSKTANDITVATSIWRSIHNPVTRDHITGAVPMQVAEIPTTLEERLLGVDDVYYARDMDRSHLLSLHMLEFHTLGIKKMLYEKSRERDALLELACGMAGDLPRWSEGGYKFVMGVDLSRDNITNPYKGAYARMLKNNNAIREASSRSRDSKPQYMDSVFLVGDCAKPFNAIGDAAGEDQDSRMLLEILYSKSRPRKAPDSTRHLSTRNGAGRALQGFNMVSCMFAIHYFFKSPETLDGFLNNVANNLRPDGLFITTFMDGNRVDDLLRGPGAKDGFVEGRKLDQEIPVWAVLKHYDTFSKEDCWKKYIEVFLENTNKLIPEFLVHFDRLVDEAAAHGLELVEEGMFGTTFNDRLAKIKPDGGAKQEAPPYRARSMEDRLDNAIHHMAKDDVQKQFSFLNRWAVFRKTKQ